MSRRPNVLLIYADDLGVGDVSCLNPGSKVHTPHMDRVAAGGVACTDAHSTSSVCSPSRYSLLTGRYAFRTRLKKGVLSGWSEPLLQRDEETLGSLLGRHGHRTAVIGKWHLGQAWPLPRSAERDAMDWHPEDPDWGPPLTEGAHTAGFDESCVLPGSLDMAPYCLLDGGEVAVKRRRVTPGAPYPDFHRPGWASEGFTTRDCLGGFVARAEDFLDRHAAERPDQPFFLYFPTTSPHTPHTPRPEFVGQSDLGPYGDLIREHDAAVGRLLARVAAHGWEDDTIVVVTSDNGAHARDPKRGVDFLGDYGHRANHVYRGQKSDCWDGGHRVPFLVRWPAGLPAGVACDAPFSQADLYATIRRVLGPDADPEHLDGRDVLPLWRGEALPEAPLVHHSYEGHFALRLGRWKLVDCRGSGGWSLPEGDAPEGSPPGQLYDLRGDAGERENLWDAEPAVRERLLAALAAVKARDTPARTREPL